MTEVAILPLFLVLGLLFAFLVWYWGVMVRVADGETVVLARLGAAFGRLASHRVLLPGLNACMPWLEQPVVVRWSEARLTEQGGVTRRALAPHWQLDTRPRCYEVPPLRCLSKDEVALAVGLVAHFRLVNPVLAVSAVADVQHELHQRLEAALRLAVSSATATALMTHPEQVGEAVCQNVVKRAASMGLELKECVLCGVALSATAEARLAEAADQKTRLAQEATSLVAFARALQDSGLTVTWHCATWHCGNK